MIFLFLQCVSTVIIVYIIISPLNLDSDYNVNTFVVTSFFSSYTLVMLIYKKKYNIYYLFSSTLINLLFNNLLRLYYTKCTNSTFKYNYYDLIIISYNYSMNQSFTTTKSAILKVSHKQKRHANERLCGCTS